MFLWVEMWFKYQNNEQNLQICDVQISQIAKFETPFMRKGHIFLLSGFLPLFLRLALPCSLSGSLFVAHTYAHRINAQFAWMQKLVVGQTVKSPTPFFRQYWHCLQNLAMCCYSFLPLDEVPDIFRHFMKCQTSQIACNIHKWSLWCYIYSPVAKFLGFWLNLIYKPNKVFHFSLSSLSACVQSPCPPLSYMYKGAHGVTAFQDGRERCCHAYSLIVTKIRAVHLVR